MGKMHSFTIEGTHAPVTYELSYKLTSSLRHSMKNQNVIKVMINQNWKPLPKPCLTP